MRLSVSVFLVCALVEASLAGLAVWAMLHSWTTAIPLTIGWALGGALAGFLYRAWLRKESARRPLNART